MRTGWWVLLATLLLAGGIRWRAADTVERGAGTMHTLDGGGGQPPPSPKAP